ncbi:MAG: hypothetical protein ACJA1A_001261 [Saprospiraceae bacterium]|jgi:hypothetical protein|tara:strand:- start:7 stop:711 length:705 start_codon:yes stop_codon:yes gene_type:complete
MKFPTCYSVFSILILLVVVSCGKEGEMDPQGISYDIVQINEGFTLEGSHGMDCVYLDLNFDGENDIGICNRFGTSEGGAFLEIQNPSLRIATTETTDSIHQCIVETKTYDCRSSAMNESELDCPVDGEYSIKAFEDQGYPTIIEDVNLIDENHTFTNTGTLLHSFDFSNAFGCFVNDLSREYWLNTNEKFLIFKIEKDGKTTNGYIKLSILFVLENYDIKQDQTFIHEVGLEKD